MIRVEGLYRRQGDFLLKNISFEVKDNEYLVILGPSGSGKTTILECIAGLRKVHKGKIFIDDRDVTNIPPEKRNVSYLFQQSTVFPHMNVWRNIEYPLRLRGVPREERRSRVSEIARKLGIAHLLEEKPSNLSGGELRRVELARALVVRPSVILLDEPLSFLDALIKRELIEVLRGIKREYEKPIIHVTHDQVEAYMLADKVALIKNGEIIEIGERERLFIEPSKLYTAEFIGFENIFEGEASPINEMTSIVDINGLKLTLVGRKSGKVKIGFRAEDVVVFSEKPKGSSIRNIFEGEVVSYQKLFGIVLLNIKVEGNQIIRAMITRGSFDHLEIELGKKVYLGIKSTAIKVLKEL